MSRFKTDREQRLDRANELITEIASCGRFFFRGEQGERPSYFEIDRETRLLYFYDSTTHERLPLYRTESKGWHLYFSEGDTLKELIRVLARYIDFKELIVHQYMFGPWEKWRNSGDLWGYGKDMRRVRAKAFELGILRITLSPRNTNMN